LNCKNAADHIVPVLSHAILMSKPDIEPESYGRLALPVSQSFFRMLEDLATSIPSSEEPLSANPRKRAKEIVCSAGLQAGVMSAGLALPPGPLGMLTVIPDLLKVWQIQQRMVADIAAGFGKSAQLSRQMMVYCLFRQGAAMLVRDVVARVGERVIVKQAIVSAPARRAGTTEGEDPASRPPLSAVGNRQSSRGPTVRALIHGGNGLTWQQVRIEVSGNKRILLKAPGQEREFRFSPNIRVTADYALGMLMRLAADGEWRNLPPGSLIMNG